MIMLLITHVSIALASIAIASIGFVKPSFRLLYTSYTFIAATLVSGTLLIIMSQSGMLKSCLMGIAYSLGVTYLSLVTRRKLAVEIEQ